MFTKPDNSLQVLFERSDDKFLCIVKKYGTATNADEAIAAAMTTKGTTKSPLEDIMMS